MKRIAVWPAVLGCLLALTAAHAALWQEDFASGAEGWTGADGSPAATGPGRTGPGLRLLGSALRGLRPSGLEAPTAWTTSPALARGGGEYLLLRLQISHLSGEGRLALAFQSAAAPPGEPPLPAWTCELPADGKWRSAELLLLPPAGEGWRLLLACSEGGEWAVDDLSLEETTPRPPSADPVLQDVTPASLPDPLPADWEPGGLLNAQTRAIGDETELLVDVGGLVITLSPEVTLPRGGRDGVPLLIDNRGEVDKQLTIVTQGPPGVFQPSYTLPIRASGVTGFAAPCQVFATGDAWLKLTFACQGESASVPVRVHAQRAYPALGVSAFVSPALLPWGFVAVTPLSSYAGGDLLTHLPLPAPDQLAAWAGQVRPTVAASALVELTPPSDGVPAEALVGAYRTLWEQVLPQAPGAALVSPAWPVAPSESGLLLPEVMSAAYAAGLGGYTHSVGLALSRLPVGLVLSEKVDGRRRELPNPAWEELRRQYDLAGLRAWLTERGARLPLLLDLSGAPLTDGAAGRAQALALTRLLLELTWQGATGVVVPADLAPLESATPSPACQAVAELGRELAGAYPVWLVDAEAGFCGRGADLPITYWAFARGREGILFVANNTSEPQEIAAEVRAGPVQMQVLRLAPLGPLVTRQTQDVFKFSSEARERHQPAVYLRLQPGEIVGLSIRLDSNDPTWLRSLGRKPTGPTTPPPIEGPKPLNEKEKPWWE